MRFGLILPSKGAGTGPALLDAGAGTAASLGWSSVWVTDHLLVPRGAESEEYGTILEALTALTWVGARHEGLALGTSVIIPAMRDAVQLAKELTTVDILSGGRLIVGVGVGDDNDLPEYTNLGKADRFRVRGAYLDETIALWRHLWGGNTSPFEGHFHRLEDYTFLPLPAQGASIPIWSGGRSQKAVDRAIRLTDGYHASQTGPDDLRARLPGLLEGRRRLGRPRPTISIRARVKPGAPRGAAYALSGTPEEMLADVRAFADLGVDELTVVFDAHDPRALRDAMEHFDRDVLAPFRAAPVRDAVGAAIRRAPIPSETRP